MWVYCDGKLLFERWLEINNASFDLIPEVKLYWILSQKPENDTRCPFVVMKCSKWRTGKFGQKKFATNAANQGYKKSRNYFRMRNLLMKSL